MKSSTRIVGNTHAVVDITRLSRQRWKQLCLYAIGLCVKCGQHFRNHTQHCEDCDKRHRSRAAGRGRDRGSWVVGIGIYYARQARASEVTHGV